MVRSVLALSTLLSLSANAAPEAPIPSEPAPISLNLTLPGGKTKKFDLYERHTDKHKWIYRRSPDGGALVGKFDGVAGEKWMERAEELLNKARPRFESMRGMLSDCTITARPSQETFILLDDEVNTLIESRERSGYTDINNPGPIIESRMWDDQSMKMVLVHEAVHLWCGSPADKLSRRALWIEEGVADWIAFDVIGAAPQSTITSYFKKPCDPTLYGSSFLWVLARMLSDNSSSDLLQETVRKLAMLHVGERKDLGSRVSGLMGKLVPDISCEPETGDPQRVAHGAIAKTCPPLSSTGLQYCIPIWRMPWGIQVTPPKDPPSDAASVFIWTEIIQ